MYLKIRNTKSFEENEKKYIYICNFLSFETISVINYILTKALFYSQTWLEFSILLHSKFLFLDQISFLTSTRLQDFSLPYQQKSYGLCFSGENSFYSSPVSFFFLFYNSVLVLPYINMNPPQVYTCSPSWTLLPPPVSFIEPGLATHFIHDIIHVSMPFSQIIPPSPSPIESKRLLYTLVSLLLSRIQGYCYHLSKFHIYVLVYCIGVFLSGLLHSV